MLCHDPNVVSLCRISLWFFANSACLDIQVEVKYKIIAFYVEDLYLLLYGIKPDIARRSN